MTEGERRARLIGWLDAIERDVQDLLLDEYIFWAIQEMTRRNPQLTQASSLFKQWMASNFVQATAVGVRRQAKANDDSISLKKFLQEVERYPSLVSRAHYVSFFQGREAWLVRNGQRDFDRIVGEGSVQVSPEAVHEDIQELQASVVAVEHYVDRRIAHLDRRGLGQQPIPVFNDLTQALKTLERLIIKYHLLLKGSSQATLLPVIQFDWKDVFRFTWEPGE